MLKLKRIIQFFFIFLLIFYNKDSLPSIYNNMKIDTIYILFLYSTLLILIHIYYQGKILTNSIIYGLILIFLVYLTMVLTFDYSGGNYVIILSIIIAMSTVNSIEFKRFSKIYVNILTFLGLYSLIFLLFSNIVMPLPSNIFPRFSNISNLPFIDAGFTYIVDIQNYFRNYGIFREPGVYQFFVIIAIMFEMFFQEKKSSNIKLVILFLVILSTFSTVGYFSIISLIIVFFFKNEKNKGNKKAFMAILVLFIIMIILVKNNSLIEENLFRAVEKVNSGESSLVIRQTVILANIETWLDSPIYGSGIEDGLSNKARNLIQQKLNSHGIFSVDNTSTITGILVAFGLFFSIAYLVLLYKFCSLTQENKIIKISLFFIIFININSQMLMYNELIYVLLFYGSMNIKSKRRDYIDSKT